MYSHITVTILSCDTWVWKKYRRCTLTHVLLSSKLECVTPEDVVTQWKIANIIRKLLNSKQSSYYNKTYLDHKFLRALNRTVVELNKYFLFSIFNAILNFIFKIQLKFMPIRSATALFAQIACMGQQLCVRYWQKWIYAVKSTHGA